jgi:hypothetical protein
VGDDARSLRTHRRSTRRCGSTRRREQQSYNDTALRVFAWLDGNVNQNGRLLDHVSGVWTELALPVDLVSGHNEIRLAFNAGADAPNERGCASAQ